MKSAIKKLLNERLFNKSSEPQIEALNKFINFASTFLGIKPPKVILQFGRKGLVTTASYGEGNIHIYAKDRALVDIMRSIAHEMTHMKQDAEDRLKATHHTKDNAAGSPIEDEANSKAGEIIRKFGEKYPKIYI